MRKIRLPVWVLLFCIGQISPVFSESPPAVNLGISLGAGATTCAEYGRAMRDDQTGVTEMGYFSWAQGFMSGLNMLAAGSPEKAKNLTALPVNDQKNMINVYCDSRPLRQYGIAVLDLYLSLPSTQ